MFKVIFILTLTCFILITQNCSQFQKHSTEIKIQAMPTNTVIPNISYQFHPMRSSEINFIKINNTHNTLTLMNEVKLNNKEVFTYLMDVTSGTIQSFDVNYANLNKNYCLSEDEKKELKRILANSQLCIPDNTIEDIANCHDKFRLAYAILIRLNDEIRLGEKNKECEKAIDICHSMDVTFQNFLKDLLKSMRQHTCPKRSDK